MNKDLVVDGCRLTGEPLRPFLDLGMQPIANAFSEKPNLDEFKFPMVVGIGPKSGLVQLIEQPKPEVMFHDEYPFFTASSQAMCGHFQNFSRDLVSSPYWPGSTAKVLEIGCNDATLLSGFLDVAERCVGIDPAENVLSLAAKRGVSPVQGFFGEEAIPELRKCAKEYDVIVAANVVCHIPDIKSVGSSVDALLSKQGVFTFEEPYWGDVFRLSSYDQFYDEHVFMFSCQSVSYWAETFGMELVDAEHQNTHGGSMRYYLARKGVYPVSAKVVEWLDQETAQGINTDSALKDFAERVRQSKDDLRNLLRDLRESGEQVWAYAATSKSTTVFNYCNLTGTDIYAICDSTAQKQGRYAPGSQIPVVSVDEFHDSEPKFVFLSAWNHAKEIWAKEYAFNTRGGKWITHVPQVGFINPE